MGLGLASGLLLWLAFPPADRGALAWVALVPLFLLVRSARPRWSLYLGAWLGGMVFSLLAVAWVRLTDPSAWLGWVVLAFYLSLYWPAFLGLARLGVRRLGLPLLLVAPVVWVGLEYVRGFALTGFPWLYLAHTQYRFLPFIQIADLTGVWGPSLLVALVNAWLVEMLTQPWRTESAQGFWPRRSQAVRAVIVVGLLAACGVYGLIRIGTAQFRPGPRIALLQSSFRQELKSSLEPEQIIRVYRELMVRALRDRAELIVWPETSFPYYFTTIAPGLNDATLERLGRQVEIGRGGHGGSDPSSPAGGRRDPARHRQLGGRAGGLRHHGRRVPAGGTAQVQLRAAGRAESTTEQRYDKLHLVPFGEYVPLLETFPWLTRLTPYHGELVPRLSPGKAPSWLDLKGLRYASAICFEDSLPSVVRRSFAEVTDGHAPDVILNISNDGWFQGSSELDMHLATSVFRAIENRVPVARAVNTGISAIIDGNGRIRSALPRLAVAALTESVPLDGRGSLYIAGGEWLGLVCALATAGLILGGLFRPRPKPEGKSEKVL